MEAILKSALMALIRCGTAGSIVPSVRRLATVALYAIVGAVFATASIGVAAAALWIWALPRLGPVGAPLAVAGALLVVCLAAIAMMRHVLRSRRTRSPANAAPALLLDQAMAVFQDQRGAALTAALIAGLAAGRSGR
jgi:hypothetical protein